MQQKKSKRGGTKAGEKKESKYNSKPPAADCGEHLNEYFALLSVQFNVNTSGKTLPQNENSHFFKCYFLSCGCVWILYDPER